jgi:DNA helicase-2/ATP-dependent DNA helicase PcrA
MIQSGPSTKKAGKPEFQLTPAQLKAISHPAAPLMIMAGAGTGKTTTLIHRVVHLIEQQDIPPEQILALTFSEKAAAELQLRVREATYHDKPVAAATFHAFCYQAVLEFEPAFRPRSLMTDGDILFLLREHYAELQDLKSEVFRREPLLAVQAFKRFFDHLRDELIQPEDLPTLLEHTQQRLAAEGADDWEVTAHQLADHCAVFPLYQRWKAENNLVDYGDMVYECWRLMVSESRVLPTLRQRYRAIVVDEFQDNNYALNMIVGRLAEVNPHVTVVGDDDQCIYSFRGASSYNIRDFQARYQAQSGYAEAILDINHRSTQPILDLANEIIALNTGRQIKQLHVDENAPPGTLPTLAIGSTTAQTGFIAQEITRFLEQGTPPGDIAILTRTHAHAREVVSALVRHDIPCRHVNVKFFQVPAIRTALAWCAVVADTPTAPAALYRLLGEHAGPDTGTLLPVVIQRLADNSPAAETGPEIPAAATALCQSILDLRAESRDADAAHMLRRILEVSGLYRQPFEAGFQEDRVAIANLNLLQDIATNFTDRYTDNQLPRFVHYMEVMQAADAIEARVPDTPATDAVHVMTVHAAKGREFPRVFIPFLQSARFPLNYRPSQVMDSPPSDWHHWQPDPILDGKTAHLEEERRLLYVAITRARSDLVLLTTPQRRSSLIRNLPAELVTESTLMEPEDQADQTPADLLRQELKQRLATELSRGAYDQAQQLVDALRLVDEHESGLAPDFSSHPLGDELRQRLTPAEDATAPPGTAAPLTLSASSIGSYETCPLMYRFAHVERIPGKEDKPYLTFGRIIHRVLEAWHNPTDEQPRPPILDLLDSVWQSEGFTYPQEEAQYREDARTLLTTYLEHLADRQPPVLGVEHRFSFALDGIEIKGRIDRIDLDSSGHLSLIDYKTSRRKMTAKEARQDPQLALYALYVLQVKEIDGRPLDPAQDLDLTYYFLRADEPEVTISFDAPELDAFRQRIAEVAAGIRRRDYPAHTGYHCRYCDYRDLVCPEWEQGRLVS